MSELILIMEQRLISGNMQLLVDLGEMVLPRTVPIQPTICVIEVIMLE